MTATVGASGASAVTVTVNTTSPTHTPGDGLCTLEEAFDYANNTAESDCSTVTPTGSGTTTIVVPAGHYVVPALVGELGLVDPTNLVGAGAGSTDIDGGGATRVLYVGSTVSVQDLTISGGATSPPSCLPDFGSPCPGLASERGAGIYNAGVLTLNDVTVSGNSTGSGTSGAIVWPVRCVTVGCQQVQGQSGGNGGNGAGIYNGAGASLTIKNSLITGNHTGSGGDGIAGHSGTVTYAGPGVAGGTGGSGGLGAGIYNASTASLTITNSTISSNFTGAGGAGGSGTNATSSTGVGGNSGAGGSGGNGAGIYSLGALTINGSTLSGNTAGDGGSSAAAAGSAGLLLRAGPGGFGAALDYAGATGPAGAVSGTIVNSTFAGNVAGAAGGGANPGDPGSGGAIANDNDSPSTELDLTNVTIADNQAGDDAAIGGSGTRPVVESDSVIASNDNTTPSPVNCDPQVADGLHNVAWEGAVTAASGCPGLRADPDLGLLAANGGPTQTLALGSGSPAIDLVPAAACVVASDQRGVTRPVGAACDAGAYESAPPVLAAVTASATGPQTATITGQVTPNLTDAKVTVDYGTATSYGLTATTDAGAGSGATPFDVSLSGLAPGTTYHAKVVVTNTDGTTVSQDLTFATQAAALVSSANVVTAGNLVTLGHVAVIGNVVKFTLTCAAHAPTCSGVIKLTSLVTTQRGKVVGVAAAGLRASRPKRATKSEVVGAGSYAVPAGASTTASLTLNGTGRRLLKARRHLPALATFTGSLSLQERVSFTYPRLEKPKARG